MSRHHVLIAIAASVLGISGCASTANNNFNSTLWMQNASEYKANAIQTYRTAERNIDAAISDKRWTAAMEQQSDYSGLPLAVVMDIDETVLDNSRYQARLITANAEFSAQTWDEWISLRQAAAVPGAVDFIRTMKERNVAVIYVTNRECRPRKGVDSPCPQEQDTLENFAKVGISDATPEHILMQGEQRGWVSEKKSRREFVAAKYRIVMLFGDDLGDFLPGVKSNSSPSQRDALVSKHEKYWGHAWYILPNPTYGSWLRVLGEPKSSYLVGY